ncbi:uncharacterized protein LOC144066046 isoform X2 [Stigmatopora argus]
MRSGLPSPPGRNASADVREARQALAVLMAENVRSPFDYREPPTLDSDGDGSKPPPSRGRVCGRKRKGTPVKVCDRAYVTEDEEEESMSEHSYSPGDGQYPEGGEDGLHPPGSPYYITDPAQLCVPELGEEGAGGVRGPVLFHPPPNCRIREVHCGTQVRLVVIAIRDIAKGEEITVDYSLTDWGDNAMDEEGGPHPLSLSVSDYLTPSWSLSPSSSPLTHSEPSDSDREEDEEEEEDDEDEEEEEEEEEEMEEMRGRLLRRRKKRKIATAVGAKKKAPPASSRGPGRPCSSFSTPPARPEPPPTTANVAVNMGGAPVSRRQHCPYCGRHYRSLARHLEKHHANQPEVRSAMELAQLCAQSNGNPTPASGAHGHSFAVPQTSAPSPSLFARERDLPGTRSGAVSFSLNLSPPAQKKPRAGSPPQAPPPSAKRAAPPTAAGRVKSPTPPPATSPPRRGRRLKREKLEEQQKAEVDRVQEDLAPPPTPEPNIDPEEDLDLSADVDGDCDTAEDKNGEPARPRRHHMSPLLSSLSSLVAYVQQQQHAAFLSLGRTRSAESWRQLCHASLSLLILFNRHRECEVAKLTIQDYHKRALAKEGPPTGAEAALSPFERKVLCHLPRVGVTGKRGRVQPLILPPNCESCIDQLLQTAAEAGVDPESPYVFSRPYHSPATPLRGTDLLRNLARASGVKNPGAITGTRVRRQVAILAQLLLLDEGAPQGGAVKRLEIFLETEFHVTQNCSTIPRDAALMGRVARVVLYGEKEGVLFRGMSLQHICLELDVMSGNSLDSFSENSEAEILKEEVPEKVEVVVKKKGPGRPPKKKRGGPTVPVTPSGAGGPKKRSLTPKSGKRGVLKRPWSEAERVAVETHLKRNLAELRVPAKADCERCLELCPLLVSNQRDWRSIKFYVHNRIQLLKKQVLRESAALAAAAAAAAATTAVTAAVC